MAGLRAIIESIYAFITNMSQYPMADTIISAFVSAILGLLVMVGIAFCVSMIIALPIRIGFASKVNHRIDNVFAKLLTALTETLSKEPSNEHAKKMYDNINELYLQWNSSRVTKFTRQGEQSQDYQE